KPRRRPTQAPQGDGGQSDDGQSGGGQNVSESDLINADIDIDWELDDEYLNDGQSGEEDDDDDGDGDDDDDDTASSALSKGKGKATASALPAASVKGSQAPSAKGKRRGHGNSGSSLGHDIGGPCGVNADDPSDPSTTSNTAGTLVPSDGVTVGGTLIINRATASASTVIASEVAAIANQAAIIATQAAVIATQTAVIVFAMTATRVGPSTPASRKSVRSSRSYLYQLYLRFRALLGEVKEAAGIDELESNIPPMTLTTPKAANVNVIFCIGLGSFNTRTGLPTKYSVVVKRFVKRLSV
ncbi:hypothetical protein BGZ98_008500, partial [Dissophora globulifera]